MKSIQSKKPSKDQREKTVLLGLVELYLESGKPVGSNTLRENGFEALSSATIRNYFSRLEEAGFLKQQHSSGGRIPTNLAYKLYAETHLPHSSLEEKEKASLFSLLTQETKEVSAYLQRCAERISDKTDAAVFLSSPRFDHDFVLDAKLVPIDGSRFLCVLITDFGVVRTEMLYMDKKLSDAGLKNIEKFFHWKITGLDKPDLSKEEEEIANKFYNEAMLRHIVSYTNFSAMDIHKTGFSKLLAYPDFSDATSLASCLSFFENNDSLRQMLGDACKKSELCCWIGEDLPVISSQAASCSVLIIPYRIHNTIAGAIGILGPSRMPYKELFGLLKAASEAISQSLTKNLYKFKIAFRQPSSPSVASQQKPFLDQINPLFLEDQTR